MAWLLILATPFGLGILWALGRIALVGAARENNSAIERVGSFHNDLVVYANSIGRDHAALTRLLIATTEVERTLGLDNYPSSLRMGHYMLQSAPVFPMALHEMQRQFGDGIFASDASQTAAAVDGILFRHLGRREALGRNLLERMRSPSSCIAHGWERVASFPLALLRAFGLLTRSREERARASLLFRLWSLLLALMLAAATIAGPVLSYLADRGKIDSELKGLLPFKMGRDEVQQPIARPSTAARPGADPLPTTERDDGRS